MRIYHQKPTVHKVFPHRQIPIIKLLPHHQKWKKNGGDGAVQQMNVELQLTRPIVPAGQACVLEGRNRYRKTNLWVRTRVA